MGRHAQGWKLKKRGESANYYVYFWHDGRRQRESTGERDLTAAKAAAARIYAEVISGRRPKQHPRTRAPVVKVPLDILFAKWLASLETELSRETVENYAMYVEAHYVPFFGALERMTTSRCSDYVRTRLRHVQRKTVIKELSALRRFLSWCIEEGYLLESDAPVVKPPPRRATGTADDVRRKVGGWINLTAEEAEAIIARLPERSRMNRPARAYYRVLWETGLRPQTVCSIRAPEDYFRGSMVLKIRGEADGRAMCR